VAVGCSEIQGEPPVSPPPGAGERALAALQAALRSDSSLARCCAARALGRAGEHGAASRERLAALLRDPDPDVRMEAATALGRLGAEDAGQALLEVIESDPEGDVRIAAAKALARIAPRAARDRLLACVLADGYPGLDGMYDEVGCNACWEVQAQALEALGRIGDPRVVAALLELLANDQYGDLQERGFQIIAALDAPRARAFLLEQLARGSALTRRRAVEALLATAPDRGGRLPGELRDALAGALVDRDPAVRSSAARALGACRVPGCAAALATLLGDDDPEVRRAGAAALAAAGGSGALEHLHPLLTDRTQPPEVRRDVARALAEIADPRSTEVLLGLLDGGDESLRFEAVGALGAIGAGPAGGGLAALLGDREQPAALRVQAARALGRILALAEPARCEQAGEGERPASPEEALREAIADPEPGVAYAALSALIEARPEGASELLCAILLVAPPPAGTVASEAHLEGVLAEAARRDPSTSTLAAILAGQQGLGGGASSGAEQGAPGAGEGLRVLAARLLGGLAAPCAAGALLAAYRQGSVELRCEILRALASGGDPGAAVLAGEALAGGERDLRVAAIDALAALAALGGAAAERELLAALDTDPDPDVRQHAVRALGRHGGALAGEGLARALGDPELAVAREALRWLDRRHRSAAPAERLVELAFRFSAELRGEVGATLGRLGGLAAVSALVEILDDPLREELHWVCLELLGDLLAARRPRGAPA